MAKYSWDGYISVNVYRNGGVDCSNNGVTSDDSKTLVVAVNGGNITEEEVKEYGYVVLYPKEDAYPGCPLRFAVTGLEGKGSMFGGNFVYSSDGRFSRRYGNYPVSVHDRVEG
jgi:hypothetical protein